MIGVIAAANTVPGRHSSGITSAATALAAPAIRRVLTERPPPCVRCSRSRPSTLASAQLRWTWEPGTMSSAPSGQRTHALWPPS